MSSYYNGSQEREWPDCDAVEEAIQDPEWCYTCDRPKNDCGCVENGGNY